MRKLLKLTTALCLFAMLLGMSSCKSLYKIPKEVDVPLVMTNQTVPATYRNLDYPINVTVTANVTSDEMYDDSKLPSMTKKFMSKYYFTPALPTFGEEAAKGYMQQMGFDVRSNANYRMQINIKKFQMYWIDKSSAGATVILNYSVVNEASETIIPSQTVNAKVTFAGAEQFGQGLGRAYATALSKIDWDSIAALLTTAKNAKQEANKQVNGSGDTALEHTIIRWYIDSKPKGADVQWRVVSSTPDVSNTNFSFVGTTPYESTESFDIKGLTYNNSGNVQIEVTCERDGYLTQKKRFNLRQVIDQKEISAKFNLVKDED